MRDVEKLAACRVERGKGGFKAIPMTEKEIEDRNFFIRFKLRGKPAWMLSDEQIEQVRLYQMGDIWIIEKEIAPVQDLGRVLPANLVADGYSYCGSFAGTTGDKEISRRSK